MKAVVVKKLVKTVDELKVIDTDVPKCSDSQVHASVRSSVVVCSHGRLLLIRCGIGQVLVDVKAIGLNFFDILMCQGKYQVCESSTAALLV